MQQGSECAGNKWFSGQRFRLCPKATKTVVIFVKFHQDDSKEWVESRIRRRGLHYLDIQKRDEAPEQKQNNVSVGFTLTK